MIRGLRFGNHDLYNHILNKTNIYSELQISWKRHDNKSSIFPFPKT